MESIKILNKYRNYNYKSTNQKSLELAMAIDDILPKYINQQNKLKNIDSIDLNEIQDVINNINTYGVTLDISIDVTPLQNLIDMLKE